LQKKKIQRDDRGFNPYEKISQNFPMMVSSNAFKLTNCHCLQLDSYVFDDALKTASALSFPPALLQAALHLAIL